MRACTVPSEAIVVSALADALRATGDHVVQMDCRAIEPTERGLLAALGSNSLESLVEALAAVAPRVEMWQTSFRRGDEIPGVMP